MPVDLLCKSIKTGFHMRATQALNGLNKIEKIQEQTFRLLHNFAEAHNGNAFDALLSLESLSLPLSLLKFFSRTYQTHRPDPSGT